MRVFLSAYACEPGKGSEPGVGWRWACGMAGRVDLHVLTRESNRHAIETALETLPAGSPIRSVVFHYHDLSTPWRWAKRRRLLPTMAYYALWQKSVSRRFHDIADQSDVVHHLTFCTLLCPGFWKLDRAAFVVGPVGAPQVNSHYLPLFGNKAWLQVLRGWILERFLHFPWLRRLLQSAAAVVPANSEARKLLAAQGIATKGIILDTGCPEDTVVAERSPKHGFIRLLYAGQLERRKGLELALRALAEVSAKKSADFQFTILGSGPDGDRLKQLAAELGLAEKVNFPGSVRQSEVSLHLLESDAFLFTSVRDTSGGVNLEAMAHGLPIICIAHQGVGDITDADCSLQIKPQAIPSTISELAKAIDSLANDPILCRNMGRHAAIRAREKFSWESKFDEMLVHYHEAAKSRSGISRHQASNP